MTTLLCVHRMSKYVGKSVKFRFGKFQAIADKTANIWRTLQSTRRNLINRGNLVLQHETWHCAVTESVAREMTKRDT